MRRTIHLTGRKELAASIFDVELASDSAGDRLKLHILPDASGQDPLREFPHGADLKVRVFENYVVDIVSFGTVGSRKAEVSLPKGRYRTPTCQVRIVSRDEPGKLIASSRSRRTGADGQLEGILSFLPYETAPRLWQLVLEDDNYPILRVDKEIRNVAAWASTDPVFLAAVLPTVIEQVWRRILDDGEQPEEGWKADWLHWANTMMPGTVPPITAASGEEKEQWLQNLGDAFARRHHLAKLARTKLEGEK
jgi:hypothetical protein